MRIGKSELVVILIIIGILSVGFASLFWQERVENAELKEFISWERTQKLSAPPKEVATLEVVTDKGSGSSLLSRVATLLLPEEGVRTRPYLDSKGYVTVGIGRNLSGNGVSIAELNAIVDELDYDLLIRETHIENGRVRIKTLALANKIFVKPLTKADIHLLLLDDLRITQNDALTVFGSELWGNMGEPRKQALLDTLFELGLPRFEKFVNLIAAVKQKDWNTAAVELLKSEAADEAPGRFFRNYYMLKNNKVLER